jgi:hypothetical protein
MQLRQQSQTRELIKGDPLNLVCAAIAILIAGTVFGLFNTPRATSVVNTYSPTNFTNGIITNIVAGPLRMPATGVYRVYFSSPLGNHVIMPIQGTNRGLQYVWIQSSNEVVMTGTFEVVLTNGFVPALGDSFEPVTFPSHLGWFTNFIGPDLGSGLGWWVNYETNAFGFAVVERSKRPHLKLIQNTSETGVTFALSGVVGESYVIEASENGTNWLPVLTNIPSPGFQALRASPPLDNAGLFRAVRIGD